MKIRYHINKVRYSLNVLARIYGREEIDKICPCCGFRGRFDTIGNPPRYGARCPNCKSLERHRLLILADKEANFFEGKEILHFAPEKILTRLISSRSKRYTTADIMPNRAENILNIEQIDQPEQSWDVVVCSHILEHVDDQAALSELHRILRPKGLLIIMVPIIEGWADTYENSSIISKNERKLHFGQFDHIRYYGRDIRGRIRNSGFSVREYTAYGSQVVKYGLLRGEKVFVCVKQTKA